MHRYTIGLLTDSTESAFHTQLLLGITDYAKEKNINLLVFSGGPLQSSDINEVGKNLLYYLVTKENVDGLLVMTSTIGFHIGPGQMNKLLKFYDPIPIVSISTYLHDYPSIIIDNKSGIQKLMAHLIEEHNCRRFACIRGPKTSQDANERFETYISTLKKFNLPINKSFIYEGQYGSTSGINAVNSFIKEDKLKFDAIVASNDDTALGAIYTLKKYGIEVPGKVKIIGFDNILDSIDSSPKLTTVNQPIYNLGRTASKMLVKCILGKLRKKLIKLPVECIIRESCGCTPVKLKGRLKKNIFVKNTPLKKIYYEYKEKIIKQINYLPEKLKEQLVNSFYDEYINMKNGIIIEVWKKVLVYGIKNHYSSEKLYSILSDFREIILHIFTDNKYIKSVNDYIFKMQEMIGNIFLNRHITLKMKREDAEVRFRLFYETLQKTRNLQSQIKIIYEGLISLGFTDCFLYIFQESEKSFNKSKQLFAIQNGKVINKDKKNKYYDSDKLLSKKNLFSQDKQMTYILVPLFYGTYQVGFMIVNFLSWEVNIYEYLRLRISSVLRNSILFENLKIVSNNINNLIDKKTIHLSNQNKQLRNEVKKLQETLINQQTIPNVADQCDDFRIQRVIDFIHENYSKDITLEEAANKAFMMTTYFSKIFKKKVGKGFLEYLTDVRLKKAVILLKNRQFKVSEIASLVGYQDPNYFYRVFKKCLKITPGKYRDKTLKYK